MLSTQSNSLVDLLLSPELVARRILVLFRRFLMHLLCQVLKAFALTVLVHDFAAQHVDLALVLLVLRIGLIQSECLVENGMLLTCQPDNVQLIIDRSRKRVKSAIGCGLVTHSWIILKVFYFRLWLNLLDVLILFSEFVLNLLDLVLQNLKLALFVFELLSVDVYLVLKALRLTFVNGVVARANRSTSCN